MNELDLQFQYWQMYNVAQELENRLTTECDYADNAKNNFDAFCLHIRNLGFKMPADEEPYTTFRESVYLIIDSKIIRYNSND